MRATHSSTLVHLIAISSLLLLDQNDILWLCLMSGYLHCANDHSLGRQSVFALWTTVGGLLSAACGVKLTTYFI